VKANSVYSGSLISHKNAQRDNSQRLQEPYKTSSGLKYVIWGTSKFRSSLYVNANISFLLVSIQSHLFLVPEVVIKV
jgi:hypothetical protein